MKHSYFVCLFLCLTTSFALRLAHAQTETVLYNFKGGSDGLTPLSGLTWDGAGNFYGTTDFGGLGYGTVFEFSPNGNGGWTETILYSFTGERTVRFHIFRICSSTPREIFTARPTGAVPSAMGLCSNSVLKEPAGRKPCCTALPAGRTIPIR